MIAMTIVGEPRTKKTGQRIIHAKGRPFVVPSKRTLDWTAAARLQMAVAMKGRKPLTGPVSVRYTFYRQKDVADLGGLEAALDDALQGYVIVNDRQIRRRSSYLFIDRANPRVDLQIEAA